MKITTQLRNLSVGTIVYRSTGDIVIEQPYDAHTDSYLCRNLIPTEDGFTEADSCSVTPADMIGDEVF